MPTQTARGPVRPREEAARRALLDATVELLLEHEDPEPHVLSGPEQRRAHWERHVRSRRRLLDRLRAEVGRGGLPPGTDVEALAELMAAAAHYQLLVRPDDGRSRDRLRRAVRLLLDGRATDPDTTARASATARPPGWYDADSDG